MARHAGVSGNTANRPVWLAAAWAERRGVAQVAFGLEKRLGRRAEFKRNGQMLGLKPRCVVAFAGNGVLERLVIDARRAGIAVVDRRGPLGTHAKNALERGHGPG